MEAILRIIFWHFALNPLNSKACFEKHFIFKILPEIYHLSVPETVKIMGLSAVLEVIMCDTLKNNQI